MLTPEREEEIRDNSYRHTEAELLREKRELLAEIDRLRAEIEEWKWEYDNCCDFSNAFEEQIFYLKKERDQLREKLDVAREALEFYVGGKESEWDGCKFLTFDKFGCLDEDIAGSFVARKALEKIGVKE